MNKYIRKVTALSVVLICSLTTYCAAAEVAVVVHPSNTSSIDVDMVKKLYLGKKKSFSDGTKVKLVFQKGDTGEEFASKVLGRSSSQFKAYWAKRAFSGKGKPPKSLSSGSEVLEQVASNPNAIGIIDASEANDSIRVVLTQ